MVFASIRELRIGGKFPSAVLIAAGLALSGCQTGKVMTHGYQVNEETLTLVPEGSSREQVLLTLGTPSHTSKGPEGNETFYYISQKKVSSLAFLQPKLVDQRVLAIYLGQDQSVQRIANYGLKEGKVFDFVNRITPTGGRELTFLSQLLGAAGAVATPLGSASKGPADSRGIF